VKLSICIHQFFDHYLPQIRGYSAHTVKAYRDAFKLFLPFAADYHRMSIDSLCLDHLCPELILNFLVYLEQECKNTARTRNLRLATLKSFSKMIRFLYPANHQIADRILNIPQKRTQKPLIGFLNQEEILQVFAAVDVRRKDGLRDYCLLHLLYDSGARASEIATLCLDDFDHQQKTISLLGKGNRYRMIELWPITADLINLYIAKYRHPSKPLYRHRLFINQRGEAFTRHGINRLCKKYLSQALTPKRIKQLQPAHCFRHSCAVNMIRSGHPVSDIKNRLGHEHVQSTMVYLHMDLSDKREVQKKFIEYTQTVLSRNEKIEELIGWENKRDTLNWLDSL